jgi:ABC-type transport system involved in multi-copper enzyme maturation permease subunit
MTTAIHTSTLPDIPPGRYGWAGSARSEWTKLRTVRSTTWSLVTMIVLSIGIGVLATATEASRWASTPSFGRLGFDPTSLSLTGLLFGQLAIGVLGILVVSAEYGTGTIRATLAAIPNRRLVLATKAAVFATVSVVVGLVVSFAAFFIGQAMLAGSAPHATIGGPGVLRAVIGAGLYLAVLGLLAMGLATIIRHTAGAISAFVGVLFILPLVTQALPFSLRQSVGKFLPANIGANLITTVHQSGPNAAAFSPWVGFALLCGYAVVALGTGAWLLQRRDA